ncbi:NAC domain-containing protein 73-like [Hordeum vulgare subsp. vulgare]|uniref:NAC domain-containing protein 73-like n=1 Tax=Hordeum vulgare subsp. vulgare TaxID=112509 RepID=UPI001D1A547C|nr:NAC domain-containing protein 73-like [Hordeum vulgare subsp. vulgare]
MPMAGGRLSAVFKRLLQLSSPRGGGWDATFLEPLNAGLRGEILRYGDLAQATYDAFDNRYWSRNYGTCLHGLRRMLPALGLAGHGKVVVSIWPPSDTSTRRSCCHHYRFAALHNIGGLPVGVKFDPTDLELLEHLEGKVGRAASHVLIDGFIPTIEEAEVICHTHPENLPGVKLDGITSHFFHKISNAYDVGKRKHRKISHSDHIVCDENLRWHKAGKSRSILDNNGVIKGWKKILVLYIGYRKGGGKAEKTNWRMHQYHLGVDQDEKHEELVVSKVFYQFPSNDAGQPLI